MCLAQGSQRSDTDEARTCGPSVSSQALYHWATALPHQGICCSHTHRIHCCAQAHKKAVQVDGGSDKMLTVRFRHLSHMLSHYAQLHARLFGSMRALLHAYLVGSIFLLEPPSTCTAFMCARAQQCIRYVCEQQMPWWDCAFAQALLSCRC